MTQGGLYDEGDLDQYDATQAGPVGLSQTVAAQQGVAAGDPAYANNKLGQKADTYGLTGAASSWYTGANTGDTSNGWDTSFVDEFISGQEAAGQEGTLGNYFEHSDATGVVTWDHKSDDGSKEFTFGDIYQGGKKVANIYDQFDRDTANLMMADWLFDGQEKAHIYADSDRNLDPEAPVKLTALDEAVAAAREQNNVDIPKQVSAQNFNLAVEERAKDFEEGHVDEAIIGGGGVGGALVAGGLATTATGVGVVPGLAITAVGAGVGATAAWLNKDALTEQAARAYEITALSTREEGLDAGIMTGINQWAGFGGKLISPMSNLTQGLYDQQTGTVGDGKSEFYELDSSGQAKRPTWVTVADVGATVTDSFLQFASPVGIALYTTQMSGTIAGEVGELAVTGGKSFDYRQGAFDSIFTDDDGNFSFIDGAAGIGKVGIDVVQLGMARGLAGKANVERQAFDGSRPYTGVFSGIGERASTYLPKWAGGASDRTAAAAARAAGGREVQVGGYRYMLDETGDAVSRRATLSLLAPSEQLPAITAGALGRRAARMADGSAASVDDFYRAAVRLSHGEKRIRVTVMNAMGEGYEEGLQAILEPISHDADLNAREIGSAALYGFAMGAGMGSAIGYRSLTADQRMFSQANLARQYMTNGAEVLTVEEWNSMTDVQKRTTAAMEPLMRETAKAAAAKIAHDQALETVGGAPAAHKLLDAAQSWMDQQNAKANPRTDGAFVIGQIEDAGTVDAEGNLSLDSMPSDAVGSSGRQLAVNLDNHREGLQIQLADLEQRLATFDSRIDATLEASEVEASRVALTNQIAQAQLTIEWSHRIGEEISALLNEMYSEDADLSSLEADSAALNLMLRDAFNRKIDNYQGVALTAQDKMALAKAVSLVFARDPHDQAGSFQVLVPQVSARLTASNSDNFLEVSHAILSPISGDYDGDKIRQLAQLVLDEQEFTSARSGAYYVGAGASVNIAAPKYETYIVGYLAEALASSDTTLASYATGALTQIGDTIRKRYSGRVSSQTMDKLLTRFYDEVRANGKEARAILLDGLAGDEMGGVVNAFARENLSNEWLWIDQVVKSNLNQFQGVYAANRARLDLNTETVDPVRQESDVRERRVLRAADAGVTMGIWVAGDSLFRMFQKLHYTKYNAGVLSAAKGKTDSAMQLEDMVAFYAALGSGVTRSALNELRAKDEITARVYIQLQQLAMDAQKQSALDGRRLSFPQALAVVANMAVLDFEVDETGAYRTTGARISLTQMLLKQSVQRDRREKAVIYDASPELQAKHKKLLAMTKPVRRDERAGATGNRGKVNAARAFVEVVGAQQLYTLLGDEAEIFGPHLTVEQYLRQYVSMHELNRRERDKQLKVQPEYLGRRSSKNLPYEFDEVDNGEISAYRSVVDSIIAVGHNRITMDAKGKLSGELARRSESVSKEFQSAHEQIRQALRVGLNKKRDGDISTDVVRRLLESNPDFARRLMDLIPNSAAAAAIEVRGNETYISNWVYELFTIRDSKEAEMHYWRNLLLAELNAIGARAIMNARDEEGEHEVTYSSLTRRMHRIVVDLGRMDDGGILLREFQDQLLGATDLEGFIEWVNTTPGVRGQQAPLTAWVDDTAEFDADKAQGGWTTVLQGAELREAIGLLRKAATRLHADQLEEKALLRSDTQLIVDIRNAINTGREVNSPQYQQLSKAIDLAADRRIGLGESQMTLQIVGAVYGLNPQSHTKGVNPDNVELQGVYDAQVDAIGFLTNYDRVMAALTTMSLDQVGGSLNELAKDSVRTMDDYGTTVMWAKPTVEQMLGLLENAETRPLARAILFPQVMDRNVDGRLSTQMLSGKSLKELLDGTTMKDMFPKDGRLSREATFRYASMVEATARKFDAHAALQRVVNDLVIARTSGSSRYLEHSDLERQAVQAVRDVVQVLQLAAEIAATNTDPDVDPLAEIRQLINEGQRVVRGGRKLGVEVSGFDLEVLLDEYVSARELETEADVADILATPTSSDAEELRLTAEADAVRADLDAMKAKVDNLRTNNTVAAVKEMFSMTGDQEADAPRKQKIVEYVLSHWTMLEESPAAKLELAKLAVHLQDTSNLTLPDLDWGVLGRAAMSTYLNEQIGVAAAGVSHPLFPDADHEADERYYDDTFAYLVEPLLDVTNPLLLAAMEMHSLAGRRGAAPDVDLISLISRTVLDSDKLGQWTEDIPRMSVAANERLYSAAAASALSQNGDSPKDQAAFSAATRRRYNVPPVTQLSTTVLNLEHLQADDFFTYLVPVTYPNGTEAAIPLAQLNNRFASEVVLHYVEAGTGDDMALDLFVMGDTVGRPFLANAAAADSGYKEIHLARIYNAVDRLSEYIADPTSVRVEIKYFHPDTQPGTPEWSNNLFYEGTSFRLDADRHDSLNATLWFANESISPAGQTRALDASKKGVPAIKAIPLPTSDRRAELEADALTDMATVLRGKTTELLTTDLGFGVLDPEFFNAVHKNMKMRHWIIGSVDGAPVMWSAEQVMEFQMANPGDPLPIEQAQLWVPSDTVLRTMLGEQGTKGVNRLFPDQLDIDLSQVPTYTGVRPEWAENLPGSLTGEVGQLENTSIVGRARQSQHVSSPVLDDVQRSQHNERVRVFEDLKRDIDRARARVQQGDAGRFNPGRNLEFAMRTMGNMLNAANLSFNWREGGVPFVGPRNPSEWFGAEVVGRELAEILKDDGFRTGWVYIEGGEAQEPTGLLSQLSLNGKVDKAFSVAPRDLVVMQLDSFAGNRELARQRLDYFIGRGAIIALGETDGAGDMAAELREYLDSMNYEAITGTRFAFKTRDTASRYQTVRSRVSTLTETRGVSPRSRVAVLHVPDLPIEENAGWTVEGNERLAGVAVTMNLVTTDALAGFNVPANPQQIEAVRRHLRGLDNTEGREALRDMAHGQLKGKERTAADAEFDRAFSLMLRTFDNNPASVLPGPGQEFGTGDMVPLVDLRGRVLLYRHGFKAPLVKNIELAMQTKVDGRDGKINVAVYPSKRENAATTHRGRVIEFRPRSGYGLQVELNIDLQQFGDKKQLEFNGMKYILGPKPDRVKLPSVPFFKETGWGVDIIGSIHDSLSKENEEDVVNNHQNAFAFFGVDFLPDVAEFFGTDNRTAYNLLHAVARSNDRLPVTAAHEILSGGVISQAFRELLPSLTAENLSDQWLTALGGTKTSDQIATAIIVYLMTDGARVDDVLRSGGFNDGTNVDQTRQSRMMPRVFTQFFDRAPLGSDLRVEINDRLNRQLNNIPGTGEGYHLHQDFRFEVRNQDPSDNIVGWLQFAEAHSSGDNPIKNGMSFDEDGRQDVSQHSASLAYQAIRALTPGGRLTGRARKQAAGKGLIRFSSDQVDGGSWEMISRLSRDLSGAASQWRVQTPAEVERRSLARELVTQYRQAIDQADGQLWNDAQRLEYKDLSKKIMRTLGLKDSGREVVDFWVRQYLGRPVGRDDQGDEVPRVDGDAAVQIAHDMLDLVQHGYLPTIGAMVPLMHVHDLQQIYRANQHRRTKWAPKESLRSGSKKTADSWDDWVSVSLGSALLSDGLFDRLFLLSLDGFMHTYQAATEDLIDLPVSMDALVAGAALDPKTNASVEGLDLVDDKGRFRVSVEPNTDLLASEAIILDTARASLADVLGGQRYAGKYRGKYPPAKEISKRLAAIRKWRHENGAPIPVDQTLKSLRKNGDLFKDQASTTNALARALINLRVGTATINPALYLSMGPEQWVRGSLDRAANIITGQSSTGAIGGVQARVTERLQGTRAGETLGRLGLESVYTPEQRQKLGNLYDSLGDRNDFRSMIYRDLVYLRPGVAGHGRFERWLEAYSKFGSRMQDPTYGMRAKTLARRYVEAAIQHIEAMPTANVITIDQVIAELATNPEFLKRNFPEAHDAGANAIAQLRSLKMTPLALALRGIYEPLSESPNSAVNLLSNVFLKVPLLFSGYATNVITTITGMQGASDITAMFLEGRKKPNSLFGRAAAALQGKQFTPADDAVFDMTSVLEGIDLSRSFIRGGLTHTGLFMAGLMAGGLGLSGEDDETKKRRRLAQLQGAAFVEDPRALENDFRNKDMIFLDWMPGLGSGSGMVQLNWTLKQFISPVLGMEKFFETGDFRYVTWGFEDAIGAFPLINTLGWSDAVSTAHELANQAAIEAGKPGNQSMPAATALLVNAVSTYERMLFENAFVNQMYVSLDRWDRDPYTLPLRDSDGTLQLDIEGNPRENNLAMQPYIDPETGEVKQGYQGRDAGSAAIHALTENRATLGFLAQAIDGLGVGDGDYWRYNMVPKERTIELSTTPTNDAQLLMVTAMTGGALQQQPSLTPKELEDVIRQKLYQEKGYYAPDSEVMPLARKYSKLAGIAMTEEGSILDPMHYEDDVTERIALMVRSLAKGVPMSDESMKSVHITWEQRAEIQDKWQQAIIQEGMSLGLDKSKAVDRMERLWNGPFEDPRIEGVGDILWKKPENGGFSYDDSITYRQLNTTYVPGPDGYPWATGVSRKSVSGIMAAVGLSPIRTMLGAGDDSMGLDNRLNSTDLIAGSNTGLRGLVRVDDSRNVPTDKEIADIIAQAIKDNAGKDYKPFTPFASTNSGGGYSGYGGGYYGGYGGYGGGGGGYSGPRVYFQEMRDFGDIRTPYGNNIPFINTSNPVVRRGDVRRERVWSERGRLKQWQ